MTPSLYCEHVCCIVPSDPNHQHLFDTDECLDCLAVEQINKRKAKRDRIR